MVLYPVAFVVPFVDLHRRRLFPSFSFSSAHPTTTTSWSMMMMMNAMSDVSFSSFSIPIHHNY
jgi:hypothetical protein